MPHPPAARDIVLVVAGARASNRPSQLGARTHKSNSMGASLANVRYAPVATKFRTAPNDAMANS